MSVFPVVNACRSETFALVVSYYPVIVVRDNPLLAAPFDKTSRNLSISAVEPRSTKLIALTCDIVT